ncbi:MULTISPECIES: riboflavin synthase [unclassified Caulobacter]|uniref:riboflavin synthase n=1 Tax=unclassified Caulobacter TaxID=2648921 RepID=UPI0013C67436|nr:MULTISPECIES: riboflavin synthase [unclassified Caulobacter]MBC6980827.1 riboflavin synthase [Caulobacter sp. 17J80-11]NEX92075.1 riboflavin synthase [Caulobacter sp. 17J65-9]
MFTGIVTDVGRVRAVADTGGKRRFEIETAYDTSGVDLGASISHAGCCLTVVDKGPGWFAVELSNETLAKTTLGDWTVGDPVNLERALKVGDELGGHVVAGHVDAPGEVVAVEADGDSWRVKVRAPDPLHRFIAPKGSVTLDGVSLTVNEVEGDLFGVNLIPHTWAVTTLNRLKPGARVNLEIDVLARYAARWRETA